MAAVGASLPVALATALRQAGVEVPHRSVVQLARALAEVDLSSRDEVFWASHACLVTRPEDRDRFERVFDAFFGGRATLEEVVVPAPPIGEVVLDPSGPDASDRDDAGDALRFSAHEVLGHKDFARCSDAELAELDRLIGLLRPRPPMKTSRRRRPVVGGSGRFDLAHTVRLAVRSLGEPVRVGRTVTSERPRRLVLLLDVSGSMNPYSRALLRFAHATSLGRRRVEVFALGTRLTRLSRALRSHDPDAALAQAAAEIVDHGGGTRLGETLRTFNDEWGVRGLARGATVVVCSDGWDRGDPVELGAQVERLAHVTHRLVWVNPLKASDGYAPLAGGMAAALPHVDDFLAGHSFGALAHLAEVVAA